MQGRERVILHSDLNNFFASVETALFPEYKGKPLIVCGDPKERHGVVLANNEEAKK
jgi:DNA polymerase-4